MIAHLQFLFLPHQSNNQKAKGLHLSSLLVLLFLVKIGVVTPQSLSHYRPYIVVGLAIVAAFLTPGPDPFSQLALLVPTYLLYELSLLASRLIVR